MTEPVICREWSPIPCEGRKAARDRDEINYVWGLGWIWWKSRDVTLPWAKCPWCDGHLPTMEGVFDHAWKHGWPDGEA